VKKIIEYNGGVVHPKYQSDSTMCVTSQELVASQNSSKMIQVKASKIPCFSFKYIEELCKNAKLRNVENARPYLVGGDLTRMFCLKRKRNEDEDEDLMSDD